MTEEISKHKTSRIIQLYIEGYTEVSIAEKLKVAQSTVSLYINRLKETVDSQGLENVGKEYGMMNDRLQSLHDLSTELRKANLTVEELNTALPVYRALQKYGIGEERYAGIMLACQKMQDGGFAAAAQELAKMEQATGLNHSAMIQQNRTASEDKAKTETEPAMLKSELQNTGHELIDVKKKRSLAEKELSAYLDEAGLDRKRLESVEKLATVLKKARVGDAELEGYINRESLLQKTGISSDIFTQMLKQVKVLTEVDQGKELLQMLVGYHGLSHAIKEKKMIVLEDEQNLVVGTEDKLKELMAEKVMLEKSVEDLEIKHNAYIHLQREVQSLSDKKTMLERDNTVLVTRIGMLKTELSGLQELEARRKTLLTDTQDLETKINSSRRQLDMLNAFLGFINPSSYRQVEEFAGRLPSLLVGRGEYSPEILRDFVLQNIMGQKLRVLKCASCNATIFVDKDPPYLSMISICPACGTGLLKTAWNEAEIMQVAMKTSLTKQLAPLNHDNGEKTTLHLNKVRPSMVTPSS